MAKRIGTPDHDHSRDGDGGPTIDPDEISGADVSDTAPAGKGLETDGNGNLQHAATITDGDGVDREIWVVAAGGSDPAGADPEDIIFEEQ